MRSTQNRSPRWHAAFGLLAGLTLSLGSFPVALLPVLAGCSDDGDGAPPALAEGLTRYEQATGRPPAPAPALDAAGEEPPVHRYLKITVLDGSGVPEVDALSGDPDPYVKLVYAGETRVTAMDEDTIDPIWHDSFAFAYVPGEPLAVSLYDTEPVPTTDQLLGTVTIFPEDGALPGERTIAFKAGANGSVRLQLERLP